MRDLRLQVVYEWSPGANDGIAVMSRSEGSPCGALTKNSFLYKPGLKYSDFEPDSQVVVSTSNGENLGVDDLGNGVTGLAGQPDPSWKCTWNVVVKDIPEADLYQIAINREELGVIEPDGDGEVEFVLP